MSESDESRRKYPRIPSKNSVLVKLLGDYPTEGFVKTEVVGLGGCMFYNNGPLGRGTYLDLLIAVGTTVIKALCKVAYEKHCQEDGRFEIGVEFVQIAEEDRRLLSTLWNQVGDF